MKINRAVHDPGQLLEFYEESLTALGAVCERTWYNRLEVIAEGNAATLWNADGALHQVELQFASADATTGRDAAREVFPGCPLTFKLSEMLRQGALTIDRFVLPNSSSPHPPDASVAEKSWRSQFLETTRWQLDSPWKEDMHFSLLALARCEIQAIDQHWSLHRIAVSLPNGETDDSLTSEINFHQTTPEPDQPIIWPQTHVEEWRRLLESALMREISDDMARVRARQENCLRRELERIDEYFENYERELTATAKRSSNANSKLKLTDRLAAARAEHQRRRSDQVARHEIQIHPHIDALVLVAEKAWRATLKIVNGREIQTTEALFVPRTRRWNFPGSTHPK